MQTRTFRRYVDVIGDPEALVNRDFCDRSRDLENYVFMLKSNRRGRSLRIAIDSSHLFVSTEKARPPIGGNKEITLGGNVHDEAVTINK